MCEAKETKQALQIISNYLIEESCLITLTFFGKHNQRIWRKKKDNHLEEVERRSMQRNANEEFHIARCEIFVPLVLR